MICCKRRRNFYKLKVRRLASNCLVQVARTWPLKGGARRGESTEQLLENSVLPTPKHSRSWGRLKFAASSPRSLLRFRSRKGVRGVCGTSREVRNVESDLYDVIPHRVQDQFADGGQAEL